MRTNLNGYTKEFKWMVVQEYLTTGATGPELQRKYGIKGNCCISYWMSNFGLKPPLLRKPAKQRHIGSQEDMKEQIVKTARELESENKRLKKDLEFERLRTLALNTMIDIAERDLKITIRKKSGAKQ